jgi:hypothetical protein
MARPRKKPQADQAAGSGEDPRDEQPEQEAPTERDDSAEKHQHSKFDKFKRGEG